MAPRVPLQRHNTHSSPSPHTLCACHPTAHHPSVLKFPEPPYQSTHPTSSLRISVLHYHVSPSVHCASAQPPFSCAFPHIVHPCTREGSVATLPGSKPGFLCSSVPSHLHAFLHCPSPTAPAHGLFSLVQQHRMGFTQEHASSIVIRIVGFSAALCSMGRPQLPVHICTACARYSVLVIMAGGYTRASSCFSPISSPLLPLVPHEHSVLTPLCYAIYPTHSVSRPTPRPTLLSPSPGSCRVCTCHPCLPYMAALRPCAPPSLDLPLCTNFVLRPRGGYCTHAHAGHRCIASR